jgi:hypothetical protein
MALKPIEGRPYAFLRKRLFGLYREFAGKTVSAVSLTKETLDTIKLGMHSGMEFERGMFAIIKSLMYLDGMVRRCTPDAVLMEDVHPLIGQLATLIDGPLAEAQGERWLGATLLAFASAPGRSAEPAGARATVRIGGLVTMKKNGALFLRLIDLDEPRRERVVREQVIEIDARDFARGTLRYEFAGLLAGR